MATTYACPFVDSCKTDCSQAEVGEYLRAVATPRARQLVSVLASHEGDQITLGSVLDQVQGIPEADSQGWNVEFHHKDLPVLDELGVVEYDRTASTVRYHGCPLIEESIEMVKTT